jgi:hypothetical protein
MGDYPGGDLLGIGSWVSTGVVDAKNQTKKTFVVAQYVYGCVFEPYSRGPVEEQNDSTTSHERAWAFMPYVDGYGIPTVDADGNELVQDDGVTPVAAVMDNNSWIVPIRPNDAQAQRSYKVQGLPEIEYDGDGQPEHAWIVCEWQAG